MPKGVEHPELLLVEPDADYVPRPLMPKGVEHAIETAERWARGEGAETSDAERR